MSKEKACHMARTMVNLPYGKERGMYASDGRGVTPTLKNAWVEPDPTPSRKKKLSVCSEVGERRVLRYLSGEFATTHPGSSSSENWKSFWRVIENAFPVAHLLPTNLQLLSSRVCPRYLIAHYSTNDHDSSCWNGQEVAREGIHL